MSAQLPPHLAMARTMSARVTAKIDGLIDMHREGSPLADQSVLAREAGVAANELAAILDRVFDAIVQRETADQDAEWERRFVPVAIDDVEELKAVIRAISADLPRPSAQVIPHPSSRPRLELVSDSNGAA
jgi:transketolase